MSLLGVVSCPVAAFLWVYEELPGPEQARSTAALSSPDH